MIQSIHPSVMIDHESLEDWEAQARDEAERELVRDSPVIRELRATLFVSQSKGRRFRKDGSYVQRKRRPKEVYLVQYHTLTREYEKFPWDVVASEVYAEGDAVDGLEQEARLRREVDDFRSRGFLERTKKRNAS